MPTILNSEQFRLEVDPEHGGKISCIHDKVLGRNLLHDRMNAGDVLCEDGRVFSAYGWDEAIPTLEPYYNLPRLGSAWRTDAECEVFGEQLITVWTITGWSLRREIRVDGCRISATHNIKNTSDKSSPCIWAGHILFPLEGLAEARLPYIDTRAYPSCDIAELIGDKVMEGDTLSLQRTEDAGKSWKFYVKAESEVVLEYSDAVLKISTDAPWWGIWYNLGRIGGPCIGIEPTNNPTDFIQDVKSAYLPGEGFTAQSAIEVVRRSGG